MADLVSGLAPFSSPTTSSNSLAIDSGLSVGLPAFSGAVAPFAAPARTLGGSPFEASPGDLISKYESGGRYYVGTGEVDLSNAPLDEYGFPIWEGHNNSHAAGKYQFQPDEWRKYASVLGIHDFSPESQERVFRLAFANEGWAPWLPYNKPLQAALKGTRFESELHNLATAGTGLPANVPTAMPLQGGPTANQLVNPLPDVSKMPQPVFNVNMGGQPPDPFKPNPIQILQLIQLMNAGTHKVTPVDYDPFKVMKLAEGKS